MIPMQVDLEELAFVSETSVTIRGSRRRTTVPKTIVEDLGIRDGDKLRWVLFKDGRVLIIHVKSGR